MLRLGARQSSGDDKFLNLTRAFVDSQGAHFAVEPFDRMAAHEAAAAQELDGFVDNSMGVIGGVELGHRGGTLDCRLFRLCASMPSRLLVFPSVAPSLRR